MMYDIIEEEYYQSYDGRNYSSERVYRTMMSEIDAKLQAAELNLTRPGNTYYSIRRQVVYSTRPTKGTE